MPKKVKPWIKKYLPGLAVMMRYNRSWFRYDLLAGLSVTAVAVPVAIAYAQLAGLPPVYGLYASILPLIIYAFVGSSKQLIISPDAATCVVIATIVTPLAAGDPSRMVSLAAALSIITGIFCVFAGFARLGFLTNFLARPILTGYLNGIALSIMSSQLGKLFGFHLESAGFFRLLIQFFSKLHQTHGLTLAIGFSVFILLRILKRKAPKVPGPLVAVVIGITCAYFFNLGEHGVELLGSIPAGLPAVMLPDVSFADISSLMLGAAALALISFNSGMVTARGFAVKNRYDINSNQEFIAFGLADIGSGLMQSFVVSGGDSRTAINDSVGGKSQVTSLVAAGLLILVLLFLTTPLALLPIPVLAAVLVNAALELFDLKSLLKLFHISRQEFRLSVISSLGVITLGVLPGVAIAVGMAIIQLLIKASVPHDTLLGQSPDIDGFHSIKALPNTKPVPGMVIYRFDASLLFFNADYFKSRVRKFVKAAKPRPKYFLLDTGTIAMLDSTGAAILKEVIDELNQQGIEFIIAQAKGQVRQMLERTKVHKMIGKKNFFPTLHSAAKDLCQRVSAETKND